MNVKAAGFVNRVNTVPKSINRLESELNQLRDAQRDSFDVREIRRLGTEITRRESELRRLNRLAGQTPGVFSRIGNSARGLVAPLAGAFAVSSIASFGGEVVKTLGEFQKMEAVLTNTFGNNSAAKRVLGDITKFASETPFAVNELTASYIKLANRGFMPNFKQMRLLGDLAASQGKGFDQLSEAILDAETAEFERLKEFGIRASKAGNQITLQFKGIQKQVENSPEAIRAALLALAQEAPGVAGSMEAISKTTAGQISNLGDQITQFKLSVGQAFAPIVANLLPSIIDGLQRFSAWVQRNQESIRAWVPVIAKVGAAVLTFFSIFNVITRIISVVKNFGLVIAALGSPVTLVVAVVAAAVTAIIFYWDEIKAFIVRLAQWMWDHHPFKFLIDLVDRVFPGFKAKLGEFWEGIKRFFLKIVNWIYDKVIKPVIGWFKGLGKMLGFGGKDSGIQAPASDMPQQSDEAFYGGLAKSSGLGNGKKGSGSGGLGVSSAVGSISGNGRQVQNINISIGKLVEQLVFHVQNLQESKEKIKSEVTRVLLDSVNDVNYAN